MSIEAFRGGNDLGIGRRVFLASAHGGPLDALVRQRSDRLGQERFALGIGRARIGIRHVQLRRRPLHDFGRQAQRHLGLVRSVDCGEDPVDGRHLQVDVLGAKRRLEIVDRR